MDEIKKEYIGIVIEWVCKNKDKVKSIKFDPISDSVEFVEIKTEFNVIEINLFFDDVENQIMTIFNNGDWVSSSLCTISELVCDLDEFFVRSQVTDFIYS